MDSAAWTENETSPSESRRKGRRRRETYPAPPGRSSLWALLPGVLFWVLIGPIIHLWLLPQFFPHFTRNPATIGWIPEPLAALGIGLALVGTLGAFIGTRPWPESDEAYRLSSSVLVVLFLLSIGTSCVAADLAFSRLLGPEPDLMTPVLAFGATYVTIFFATSQTLLWGDLRRLHLQRRIYAVERLRSALERGYTDDDARHPPTAGTLGAVTAVSLWSAGPAIILTWAVLAQPWPVGTSILLIVLPSGATALTVFIARHLLITLAETPAAGALSMKTICFLATCLLSLYMLVPGVAVGLGIGGFSGWMCLLAIAVHSLLHGFTSFRAISERRWAMSLTGTYRVAVARNARARKKLAAQKIRLEGELQREEADATRAD